MAKGQEMHKQQYREYSIAHSAQFSTKNCKCLSLQFAAKSAHTERWARVQNLVKLLKVDWLLLNTEMNTEMTRVNLELNVAFLI